jgi:hypothetical protein
MAADMGCLPQTLASCVASAKILNFRLRGTIAFDSLPGLFETLLLIS